MDDLDLEHFVRVAIHSLSKHGRVSREVVRAVEECLVRAKKMRVLEVLLIDTRLKTSAWHER
jgi:hypothetical protein